MSRCGLDVDEVLSYGSIPAVAIWRFTLVLLSWTLSCGGRTQGMASDSGLSEATAIGTDTGQPGSADGNPPVGDAPAFEDVIDDAQQVQDSTPLVLCDPSKCGSGCCGPTSCLPGTSLTACGFGGQACTDCTMLGLDCVSPMAGVTGGVCGSLEAGTTADGAPACGPATCVGCCAGSLCVAGTTNASCGSHGLACEECTGANVTCMAQGGAGACVGMGASCGPSTCSGCCDANGICQDPSDIGACGTAGTSCQFCLPGQACNSGQCLTTSGCGPANCPGCCQGNTCLSGSIDKSACGSGGAQCQTCPAGCFPLGQSNGGVCLTDGGSVGNQCINGCRDSFGQCQPGTTPSYCGFVGNECSACGGNCVAGQGPTLAKYVACMGGSSCDIGNCRSGCCMPDGTCWLGGEDTEHCGQLGQLCFSCGAGYVCNHSADLAVCTIACGPQNCQGCCVGGVCSMGTDPTSCGAGGNACAQCAQGQSCLSGACVTLSQCGPTLCAGCCQNDVCFVGSDNATCGTGGGPCQSCADAGNKCVGATCTP
jgi:hypothetical protein